jgi:hypothetical protein
MQHNEAPASSARDRRIGRIASPARLERHDMSIMNGE